MNCKRCSKRYGTVKMAKLGTHNGKIRYWCPICKYTEYVKVAKK